MGLWGGGLTNIIIIKSALKIAFQSIDMPPLHYEAQQPQDTILRLLSFKMIMTMDKT